MHIAIAGNIGSGKTTLTRLLSKHFGWKPHFEEVDNNPYLESFYEDMKRWSFNLQIYFLNSRFRQVMEIRKSGDNIIQDRTIYEDAYIFAANLYDMGLMETRDYENYQALFELMSSFLQAPDLLIYLRASVPTLVRQIQKRNRDYEQSIRLDYLKALNKRYENWIANYNKGKLLIIESDNIDLEKPEDLSLVIDDINASLNGLF
ncbi:MAG: deoxynucleoside kinase [Bacteroidales bacterium]|jgi:deoxyadenosine/deoxycytidine kinase|nr:deoxynucleoside kinase [Bacteroidales bacterium]MBQ2187165.1 deoxynucleoside kinase [Bacteroidales bacterium]MBQ2498931.1 deoxynucleoside kinase [Bacteroidales bacterium]MBQ4205420.1 deoxynucleoside kinase [Bacteroidales bacterium]MBR6092552.1 deoxynucleoside kinase [Bacteroidales bacterium]